MMIEWEDHGEEERQILLRYLEATKPRPATSESSEPAKLSRFWRLVGRLYLAYLRWRYRAQSN
jgi:hypothetical protein